MQAALAAGQPLGRFAWGGQHRVLPNRLRIASAISIALYAGFAAIMLGQAKLISLSAPAWITDRGILVLAGYFTPGIVANALSRSRPERLVMTPVAATLSVCAWIIALRAP